MGPNDVLQLLEMLEVASIFMIALSTLLWLRNKRNISKHEIILNKKVPKVFSPLSLN